MVLVEGYTWGVEVEPHWCELSGAGSCPQVQQQPLELLLEPKVFQCTGPYVTVFLDLEDTIEGWHL
jgi:hypothetical protein